MADSLESKLDALESEDVQGLENRRSEPLKPMERIIVQNLFDTQPKRRVAYMKRLGFEVKPDDTNLYRPIGSKGSWAEIDPGVSEYFKKGGLSELYKDAGDVLFDVGVSGTSTGLGAAGGATVGAPGGPLAVAGAVLGGAAGNATAELFKQNVGDFLLDEDVPLDRQALFIQSALSGLLPVIGKAGLKGAGAAVSTYFKNYKEAIKTGMKKFGGSLDDKMIERIAKEPEKFTREAVEGATKEIDSTWKNIFGIDPGTPINGNPDKILPNSVWGKALAPLKSAQQREIDALAKNTAADFSVEELQAPLKRKILELSQKFSKTKEEEAALEYLRDKVKFLGERAMERNSSSSPSGKLRIDYKDAREFLRTLQDDTFNQEVKGGNIIAQVITGQQDDGLRSALDKKALSVGSKLPEINAQMSEKMKNFDMVTEVATPTNIQTAFLGDDTVKKENIKQALALMDDALGLKLSDKINETSLKRSVENLYKGGKPKGSSIVNAEAIGAFGQGAMEGAGAGALVGLPAGKSLPLAAGAGVLRGAQKAAQAVALSDPERAIGSLIKNEGRIKAAENFLGRAPSAAEDVAFGIGVQAIRPGEKSAYESLFDEIE